jgi:AcrR family transcriptional regulator
VATKLNKASSPPRRPRGRPQTRPDEETLQLIVEAARAEFLSHGFAEVSMAAVAQSAGVSTKTMYRLVPTKADLFRMVVAARMGQFTLELDADALDAMEPLAAITRLLTVYGELILSAEPTAMYRLAIAESDRFPELAKVFYNSAVGAAGTALESWLRRQRERGTLRLDDPKSASGMLRGMMAMEPQRAALLRQRALPGAKEIAERARVCAKLFLYGCSPQGTMPKAPA